MHDIEILRKEYIGKSFNWLTVLDVYSGGKGVGIMFKCRCKCDKEIDVCKRKVLSNHNKSCGCLKTSKEHSDYLRQWYVDHPDECNNRSERTTKFFHDNPDKRVELSIKRTQYIRDNPDAMKHAIEKVKSESKKRRASVDYSEILPFIDISDHKKLCNGEMGCGDLIKVHCSKCGKPEYRVLSNLFIFSRSSMKKSAPPVCEKCRNEYSSSKAERDISEFVSTIYNGECIRNSRDIISPLELDLYYPEKKIAIEFNGDYWHSDKFKDRYYHYNKFKACYDLGITLVSVFERDWNNRKDDIKGYFLDLFNERENSMSFNDDRTFMNNNYPIPGFMFRPCLLENFYMFDDAKVYTCGYSKII